MTPMEEQLVKRAAPKKEYDVVGRFQEVAKRAQQAKPAAPKPEPPKFDLVAYNSRPGAQLGLRRKQDVNLPNEKK